MFSHWKYRTKKILPVLIFRANSHDEKRKSQQNDVHESQLIVCKYLSATSRESILFLRLEREEVDHPFSDSATVLLLSCHTIADPTLILHVQWRWYSTAIYWERARVYMVLQRSNWRSSTAWLLNGSTDSGCRWTTHKPTIRRDVHQNGVHL